MDWYVPNDTAATSQLRDECLDYLRRHGTPESDYEAAALVFSELVGNAIEHSDGPIWVSLNWGARQPVLSVHDLGTGFEPPRTDAAMPGLDQDSGRGLLIVSHLTDQLEVAAKAAGGSRVTATLPVRRPPSENVDPKPLPAEQLLPMPGEANERGQFGRESFLRALVVQLAQAVEADSGPAAAEHSVAIVGTSVGIRMEDAFREARETDAGPLSTADLAESLIHLKQGIGGDFFVIEADDERIVLGNHRCPFGDSVKHAPALCRMTSSVFGGIAARNRGGAAVHLEERIAVGDPQCRVTVWLQSPPAEIAPEIHFYGEMHPPDE